jgi:hypothetical protein
MIINRIPNRIDLQDAALSTMAGEIIATVLSEPTSLLGADSARAVEYSKCNSRSAGCCEVVEALE